MPVTLKNIFGKTQKRMRPCVTSDLKAHDNVAFILPAAKVWFEMYWEWFRSWDSVMSSLKTSGTCIPSVNLWASSLSAMETVRASLTSFRCLWDRLTFASVNVSTYVLWTQGTIIPATPGCKITNMMKWIDTIEFRDSSFTDALNNEHTMTDPSKRVEHLHTIPEKKISTGISSNNVGLQLCGLWRKPVP